MGTRLVLLLTLVLAGCAKAPQNQEVVRQAILDHLGKRSDMLAQSMKIEVVSVNFRDKEADAVVSVSPKEGGGAGIQMNYALVMEGNKWVVRAPAANPHGGATAPVGGDMPAGHPPVGGAGGGAVHAPSNPKAHP